MNAEALDAANDAFIAAGERWGQSRSATDRRAMFEAFIACARALRPMVGDAAAGRLEMAITAWSTNCDQADALSDSARPGEVMDLHEEGERLQDACMAEYQAALATGRDNIANLRARWGIDAEPDKNGR